MKTWHTPVRIVGFNALALALDRADKTDRPTDSRADVMEHPPRELWWVRFLAPVDLRGVLNTERVVTDGDPFTRD